jgi:hypothetical protein
LNHDPHHIGKVQAEFQVGQPDSRLKRGGGFVSLLRATLAAFQISVRRERADPHDPTKTVAKPAFCALCVRVSSV